jgi:hypothetical protein
MPWPNGLYRSTTTAPPFFTLMLRVDLADAFAPDGYVSADLYRGFLGEPDPLDPGLDRSLAELRYLGTFRSRKLEGQPADPAKLDLVLVGIPADLGTVNLLLRGATGPEDPSLRIIYQSDDASPPIPNGPLEFRAVRHSENLRVLTLEIDTTPGVPSPREVSIDTGDGNISFADMLGRAGFYLSPTTAGDSPLPEKNAWTLDQLVEEARKTPSTSTGEGFFQRMKGVSLHSYLMIATRLAGSETVTGAMFDRTGRRAAAVFYSTLETAFGRGGDGGAELRANYLFTATHEAAHCLNLPHAFEPKHLPGLSDAVATFMNYPQNYTGNFSSSFPLDFRGAPGWDDAKRKRYRNFWSVFTFRFHPQELLELRHGARQDVLVGDDVTPYRGQLSSSRAALAGGGTSDAAGMSLQLRVRRDARADRRGDGAQLLAEARSRVFEFAEPIHIEARLQSNLRGPRYVDVPLSALSGGLEIHYQTPDNQFRPYLPPATLCDLGAPRIIDADEASDHPGAFYNDICLNYAGEDVQFLTPGRYRVRASYPYGGTLLVSNILEIYVRYPTPEVEDAVIPLLDAECATFFSFRGVRGFDRFENKMKETESDRSRGLTSVKHPLLNYYYAYEGRLQGQRPMLLKALGLPITSHRDKKWNDMLPKLPFSNIMLAKVGEWLHHTLRDSAGRQAPKLRKWMESAMKTRGVPDHIIGEYETKLRGETA